LLNDQKAGLPRKSGESEYAQLMIANEDPEPPTQLKSSRNDRRKVLMIGYIS
jgi:hypothetical protein